MMNHFRLTAGCLALGFCASAANIPKPSQPAASPNIAKQARTVVMHAKDVIEIDCRVNVPTMIALPEGEEALVVQGGDAAPDGTWLYQTASGGPARRYVAVKPSVAGSSAALHIITNHNLPYTFLVREVSKEPSITADVSVFIEAGDDLAAKVNQPPTLVSADEVNRYKQEAADARTKLEAERKDSEANVKTAENLYRTQYSKTLDHGFRYDRLKAPFNITDIATDGTMTFVYVDKNHTKPGAIYTEEGKKNKANLPNYDYDAARGVYTIQGVVTKGYLSVKDSKVEFARLKGDE
ncbi:MAG: TrbG/VirB9 family P-type conjugative transfer protein [Acidobacteriota bacterium]|nr:TrbG/VirB9 family P-type conjugative transfer protein [Acidobacteriota bacterium]